VQKRAADKALTAFSNYSEKDIKFMTLLIRVEQDANKLKPLMDAFRNNFWYKLRDNAKKLGTDTHSFKMMGAFEIDLKNTATQSDASLASRDLIKQLGYDPGLRQSQYLLHLHAIVGPLMRRREFITLLGGAARVSQIALPNSNISKADLDFVTPIWPFASSERRISSNKSSFIFEMALSCSGVHTPSS
jgi:hypothetical protein